MMLNPLLEKKNQHAKKGDFANGTGIVNSKKEIQMMFTLTSTGNIMVM
jgi:hypothetical protein